MTYDLKKMKEELAERIGAFLGGRLSESDLREYASSQIWKWEAVDDKDLPPHTDDDRTYWAAIYDIRMFNDEPRQYHPTDDDLRMHLSVLRDEKMLPSDHYAFRPCQGVKQSSAYIEWERTHPMAKPSYRNWARMHVKGK
jgi:hypothetical protein